METKKCKRCNGIKSLQSFYKSNYSKDGLAYLCKPCTLQDIKKYRDNNPDKIKETNRNSYLNKRDVRLSIQKKYYEINKDKVREYRKKWLQQNPFYSKNNDLNRKYGITIDQFRLMLNEQNNKCPVCESTFNKKNIPYVDHNHITKKVRAILCRNCNTSLGLMKESTIILKNMIAYLKTYG